MSEKSGYALLTGASSGIGLEMARALAERKIPLVLVARSEQKLENLRNELAVDALVLPLDLSEESSINQVADSLSQKGVAVEYLINNAGFGDHGQFYETDPEKMESMIKVNVLALTRLTRKFLPAMIERGHGRVLNVSSTAAFQPGPLMAVYYATKAYVQSFSEALWDETQGTGVTVTALCPGPTASGFQENAKIEDSRLVKQSTLPTSTEVAKYGVDAMMRGEMAAVHGTKNRMLAAVGAVTPRKSLLKIVRQMNEKDG
ncbi:MAG: SDR family NAD(P)-dependent oxidoreductase [Fimbriimonadaceae bacterium]